MIQSNLLGHCGKKRPSLPALPFEKGRQHNPGKTSLLCRLFCGLTGICRSRDDKMVDEV